MENQKKAQAQVNGEKSVDVANGGAQKKTVAPQRRTTEQKPRVRQEVAIRKNEVPQSVKEQIEVDMSAPLGDCAREWVKVYGERAEHNVFIKNELDKQYDALVKRLADSFRALGGVGAISVNFARIYCKLAETVFKKFGKKYLPEAFNAYWNARFAAEGRIGLKDGGVSVHVVTNKASSRAIQTHMSWLNDFVVPSVGGRGNNAFQKWLNGNVRNVAIVDDCGEGVVYWNDAAPLDHDFVRIYLNRYFNTVVLKPFFEELKCEAEDSEYAAYNVEWFAYSFPEHVFDTDLRVKAIKFWTGITNEGIFREFAIFAEEEKLTMAPYPEVGILIGVGDNLHARKVCEWDE